MKVDYEEAREMADRSPRSAAGLLRLCIHKLCIEQGGSGKNLNEDIGYLVSKGLSIHVQEALDTVRIVGNSQLHPDASGVVLDATRDGVSFLFALVNASVQTLISVPKQTKEYYESLPETVRDAVGRRGERLKAN